MPRLQPNSQDILVLDRVVQNMLDELASNTEQPVYTLTPAQPRSALERIQSKAAHKPEARISDWTWTPPGTPFVFARFIPRLP